MTRRTGARLLGIYLDDHLAILAGGEGLATRALGASRDERVRTFLRDLGPDLRDDRAATAQLIVGFGRRPSALKQRLATLGQRAGVLKLNGALVGYTPLSRLVELEGIAAVVLATLGLWRVIERAGPEPARADASRRGERMHGHLERLEELRLAAAEIVFANCGGRL